MIRPEKISYLVLNVLIVLLLGACSGKNNQQVNFLIMISDDQRWDQLSYADNPIIPELKTPNMDQLAEEGVYFRNAFVTTPICAVSRACIMTGMYESTHGMNHFNTPISPKVLSKSYPAVLHDNGYRTAVLGKWGMGIAGTEKIFDVFEAWYNQGSYFHDTDSGRIHNSEWLAIKANEFFETCVPEEPFCLTICYKSPHHPYQPDERDKNLFEEVSIPKRETDTPEDYQKMASHVMDSSLNKWCYFDERGDEAIKDDFEKNFLRCVMSLDRSVGEVMQSLKDMNLDKNTVTVFLSDHGCLWGEHGLGGKWLLYEESIRTPIIIRGPGIRNKMLGSKLDMMSLNIDIAPTLLELAGIAVPTEMDGMSLLPHLQGKKVPWRKDFWMEHVDVIDVENPIPDSHGVRTEEWKYIRYINVEPEVEELYNVSADPIEGNNLVNDENYIEIKNQLLERYNYYINTLEK
ncbi:MAG: sulfatase-like hydrolase/transferase [Bacteroidetes bacterium]|jgi:arylsulfatase A-like enzyme|nr:sulfatase-like hydrolase/transferase [Bacteroidota bacterium]MBT3750594.1 sulfatase-like hydrolase/transferase [Bacteroidota bacterium]MBT4399913.1 sulfatase-like hydrolase/transferase [Bacteroidota bacterium]MBT4409831.1 sulfatase-like hydrolase/transferase [Bacteroidota bacterium]MBT7095188.1 sulfatase-like hydrolase/transferase [Bacteroidota bacterium]